MSFKLLTMFASFNGLSPNPPSRLGRHTISQDIFAFFKLNAGPNHRKAEHMLFISLMHSPGRMKDDIQKFAMLIRTEAINWSLPAIDKNRLVQ